MVDARSGKWDPLAEEGGIIKGLLLEVKLVCMPLGPANTVVGGPVVGDVVWKGVSTLVSGMSTMTGSVHSPIRNSGSLPPMLSLLTTTICGSVR